MSLNRIGLIFIAAGLIYLIGSITRQSRMDREAEDAARSRLAAEKVAQEEQAAAKQAEDQATKAKLLHEKLEQGQVLAEKMTKDRQAVERWESAAALARQSQVQVQTMIDPRQMVLVSMGKRKSRLSLRNAKMLAQQVLEKMGEGGSVKIIDATGKEIARAE